MSQITKNIIRFLPVTIGIIILIVVILSFTTSIFKEGMSNYKGFIQKGLYGDVPMYIMTPYDDEHSSDWRTDLDGIAVMNSRTWWQDVNMSKELIDKRRKKMQVINPDGYSHGYTKVQRYVK